MANQRKAIIAGLQSSVNEFQKSIDGVQTQDILGLVLMTQYFDTLKSIGADGKNSSVIIPHSPGSMNDVMGQIRDTIIVADKVKA